MNPSSNNLFFIYGVVKRENKVRKEAKEEWGAQKMIPSQDNGGKALDRDAWAATNDKKLSLAIADKWFPPATAKKVSISAIADKRLLPIIAEKWPSLAIADKESLPITADKRPLLAIGDKKSTSRVAKEVVCASLIFFY